MMSKISIAFLLCICFSFNVQSQNIEKKELAIKGLRNIDIKHQHFVKDSASALQEKDEILQQLYAQAFLAASFDSLKRDKNIFKLYFTPGNTYQWLNLSFGNLSPVDRSSIDINNRLFFNRHFNHQQLLSLFERVINYYENNGYPFASIRLDSIQIDEQQQISAALNVSKGQYYQFDSLEVNGEDIGVSEQFILNSLGLEKGKAYPENKINQISKRIREIPFLEEARKHQVQFFESTVKLILYLKKKKANRFDGIIGLMTDEADGKITLTGDVDLGLINAFNKGEKLSLQWKKLEESSQKLNVNFGMPYLFKTPFGIDFNFELYKEDTTFLDLSSRIGTNYIINGNESLQLFFETKRSSLLSKDQFTNNSSNKLPPFADLRINQFGLSYQIQKLNYRYNPQSGFIIQPTFAVGRKRMEKIAILEEQNPDIYKGIDRHNNQYDASLLLKYFFPIGKRSTIMLSNQSAATYSDILYTNELMRIGGLKTIRGFDENAIRASTYAIFTLEYRFLLDQNSYLSVFSDGAYYEKNDSQSYLSDTPIGLGAGINFETGAGIFSFNYAVGKQFDNPIELRAAKIHFGYSSIF